MSSFLTVVFRVVLHIIIERIFVLAFLYYYIGVGKSSWISNAVNNADDNTYEYLRSSEL